MTEEDRDIWDDDAAWDNRELGADPEFAAVVDDDTESLIEAVVPRRKKQSVWDIIEDTPQEAANMKLRSGLMITLMDHIQDNRLSQAQAARLFGVTQPRVSNLMRGKINLFSLDALVSMATAAGLRITLHVDK